jgi:hypothetical protein
MIFSSNFSSMLFALICRMTEVTDCLLAQLGSLDDLHAGLSFLLA